MIVTDDKNPKFEVCELKGGPHDGQTVNLPTDQDTVTFYDDGKPHRYFRFNLARTLHHEDSITALLGGRL
ncbi:MAG: hypothetical protein AAGH99_01160 [Planctomycetota bacterium]